MADLPFPWSVYAEHQTKAARCGRITDRSWGIENGLTNFLAAVESSGAPIEQDEFRRGVDRAVSTGSWVERNHARLRRKYLRPDQDTNAERRLLARVRLTEIRGRVTAAEWGLLLAVAAGLACREIAVASAGTAGSVRVQLSRIRARLRQAADGRETR
jgi:hypothetical protein